MKRTFLSTLILLFLPFLLQAQYVTEVHYDNAGTDVGEFVEIYIPNTFMGNLSDLTISLINGNGCTSYDNITADLMTAGATDAGGTYYTWYPSSIQNGAPDGVQIDDVGTVLDFITYEGTCPNSTDIGVAEAGAIGESLQLVNGVWVGPVAESPGQPNSSVTLGCTDAMACNYNMAATLDDGSCYIIGDACDDMDPTTSLDVYVNCSTCQGTSGLSTCFTDNCSFEIVPVSINADLDNWVCDATNMTYSANGFTGTTGETSDLWLILGNYDLSNTTSLYLNLDAVENFNGSGLEIFYSNAYSGCPSDASNAWSSVGTIASGSGGTGLVFDLSSAGGTNNVYIGIQYLSGSGGGEASGWDLSNISLSADVCPSSSAPITSMCSGLFDCPTLMANIGSLCDDMNPMTLNDTISPSCACVGTMIANNCPNAAITEFGYDCDNGDMNEAIEVLVPNSFTGNLADLQIDLYNGNDSSVYNTITLDNFIAGTNTGSNTFYYWNGTGSSIQNGPDGIALSYLGLTCQFISYEDTLTAVDGPAAGMDSFDVLVSQTNSTPCDETIQAFGGVWVNACATIGMGNSAAACAQDCPTQMADFGDPCDDMNAGTYNDIIQMDCSCAGTPYDCMTLNLNFGDACDDMNAATFNDVVQMDCSCAGVGAGSCPTAAFISELHYNNAGTDSLEFVEISVPAGADATQIIIDLYNGSNGTSYGSYGLTAADLVSSDATYDYYVWSPSSIQNGPDGIAISCVNGVLISFVSYGGSFAATAGPASGNTSTDIGVTEGNGTAFQSLQYDGMMWGFDCTATPGAANDLSTCGMMTGGCPDSLYVPGSISAGLYEANIYTFSDGDVIPMDTVTFHADNYVELRPNFDVPLNTQFTADIQPCGTPAAAKPTNTTTTEAIQTTETKEEK